MSTYKPKACKVCGSQFTPSHPASKACTEKCTAELVNRREAKRRARPGYREKANKWSNAWYHASPENKAKKNNWSKASRKRSKQKKKDQKRKDLVLVCAPVVCQACAVTFWVTMYPGSIPPKACSDACHKVRRAAKTRAVTAQRKAKGVCVRCAGQKDRYGTLCVACYLVVKENAAAWLGQNRPKRKDPAIPRESIKWRLVWERDGGRCQICGCSCPQSRRGTKHQNAPEIDHRVPLSKGGSHTYGNTQLACRKCNARKSNTSSIGQLPLLGSSPTLPLARRGVGHHPGVGSWNTRPPRNRDLVTHTRCQKSGDGGSPRG